MIWYAVNSPNFVQTVSKSPLENLALNKQTLIFNSSLTTNIFRRLIECGLGRLLILVIAFITTDQTSSSLTKPEQNIYYRDPINASARDENIIGGSLILLILGTDPLFRFLIPILEQDCDVNSYSYKRLS